MATDPARYFTHYWTNETWKENRDNLSGHPARHTAGNLFRNRGVQSGDFVYIVTNQGGRMLVAGRMRVQSICGRREARRKRGHDVWEAKDHVFGADGTIMDFDRVVPVDVARELRFGNKQAALHLVDGRIDQQALRGVRELSTASAQKLDELLELGSKPRLEFVETEEDVAQSLEVFRSGLLNHKEIAESVIRSTTYWVYEPLSETFGAGKFVGYRGMTYSLYEAARKGRLQGNRFDGNSSRRAIEKALKRSFKPNPELAKALQGWIKPALGAAPSSLDSSKWRFLQLADVSVAPLPDEVPALDHGFEGAVRKITVNAYERDPRARKQCIAHYGTHCSVCSVDLVDVYGELGRGFIHVHHLDPISNAGGGRDVDPVRDLRPVCPNCHAMLHRQDPPLSIDELQAAMARVRPADGGG